MINLELGELYGMENIEEVREMIPVLKNLGMPDEEINKILERSKDKKEDKG